MKSSRIVGDVTLLETISLLPCFRRKQIEGTWHPASSQGKSLLVDGGRHADIDVRVDGLARLSVR